MLSSHCVTYKNKNKVLSTQLRMSLVFIVATCFGCIGSSEGYKLFKNTQKGCIQLWCIYTSDMPYLLECKTTLIYDDPHKIKDLPRKNV